MKTFITTGILLVAIATATLNDAFSHPKGPDGQTIYERKCSRCHGDDGTAEKKGADNLKESDLSNEALTIIITEGKKKMPAFGKKLTPEEIQAVVNYTKTLRK